MRDRNARVPNLRFPEFRDAGPWEEKPLAKLISTVSPPKKFLTVEYAASGKYPIVDQSQDFICGWTNDNDAIIRDALPLIVFGDHTCVLKKVVQPFAQGADGIKILNTKKDVSVNFLFQFLQAAPLEMKGYRRHFSILKEKNVAFPSIKSGEQQKIADCLTSLDDLITASAQKLDSLKAHKKGLMQQLFPAEGETVPRLRFPEFRDAGAWNVDRLSNSSLTVVDGDRGVNYPQKKDFSQSGYCLFLNAKNVTKSGFSFEDTAFISQKKDAAMSKGKLNKGDILLTTRGSVGHIAVFDNTIKYEHLRINSGMVILRSTDKEDSSGFLFFLFNSPKATTQIKNISFGSAQPQLTVKEIKRFWLAKPTKHEQQKIAACLTSIDQLITVQAQKFDALKAHKKGMMQRLFPAANEVSG